MTEKTELVDGVLVTSRRYVGWKEIQKYVQLGRRAIRRLEQKEDFPLRRIPGVRGKVFIFAEEVERWMADKTR